MTLRAYREPLSRIRYRSDFLHPTIFSVMVVVILDNQTHKERGNSSMKKKLLKYYEGLTYAKTNDYDFCEMAVIKLIPLMRVLFPALFSEWEKKAKAYLIKRTELESKARDDINKAIETLKQRLGEANLLQEPSIKQQLCCIEAVQKCGVGYENMFEEKPTEPEKISILKRKKTKSCQSEWYVAIEERRSDFFCCNCGSLEHDHRVTVLPSYVWGFNEKVENLCRTIIKLGRKDLVQDYVEIIGRREIQEVEQIEGNTLPAYVCECGFIYNDQSAKKDLHGQLIAFDQLPEDWFCPSESCSKGDYQRHYYRVPCIVYYANSFNFVLSFNELEREDRLFLQSDVPSKDNIWPSVGNLYLLEWAYKSRSDYFRRKKLIYATPEKCAHSAKLLVLHSTKTEVTNLKPKEKRKNDTFICKRERVKKDLDTIIQKSCESDDHIVNQVDDTVIPFRIELALEDDIKLRLLVEWIPGVIEVCHLHLFHYKDSTRHTFLDDLLNNPGKPVKIKSTEGLVENAKEILRKAGISGVLAKIFICKAKAETATLRGSVYLERWSEPMLKKLCKAIQKLEHIEWRFLTSKTHKVV